MLEHWTDEELAAIVSEMKRASRKSVILIGILRRQRVLPFWQSMWLKPMALGLTVENCRGRHYDGCSKRPG